MIVPEQAGIIQRIDYEELVADAMALDNQQMREAFTEITERRKQRMESLQRQ